MKAKSHKSAKDLLGQIKGEISEVSVDGLRDLHTKNPELLLIDVREPGETEKGIIPGAKLLPRAFLELKIEDLENDRDREMVLYCAGGNRSAFAAESLHRMGYRNVHSLIGGFSAWASSGNTAEQRVQLNAEQRDRYHRHTLLPEVGEEGQIKLLQTKVALIGAGGLGCPSALYLAAAGVGTLGIIDNDVVDRSNLQRQILHCEEEIGNPKTESAKRRLSGLNPDINIKLHAVRLSRDNAREILKDYDIIVNGCDNFPTRYLVNDACYFLKKPLVDGSIFRFEGQVSVHIADEGPCYRCLYPEPPPPEMAPSCQEAGVFGVLPGIVGSMQAIETIKLVLELGTSLVGRLIMFDSKTMEFRELKLRKDPNCPLCGKSPTVTDLIDYEGFCGIP